MAMTNLEADSVTANITIHELGHIAGALRRLNKIESAPVLSAEDRVEIFRAKALCWSVVGSATEALVALMDAIAGDTDVEWNGDELEDGDPPEDDDPGEEEGHDEQAAWLERIDQTLSPLPFNPWASYRNGEDTEDGHDAEQEEA